MPLEGQKVIYDLGGTGVGIENCSVDWKKMLGDTKETEIRDNEFTSFWRIPVFKTERW